MLTQFVLTLFALLIFIYESADAALSTSHPISSPNATSLKESRLPSDFQRGVDYAHIHRRGHGYGSAVSAAELANLKKLGVNWIAITPFGYQSSATAEEIVGFPGHEGPTEFFRESDPTMTDRDLISEIASAHALGMRVTIKPQIWSRDFWEGQEWHGTIHQASSESHAKWWASYRAFAMHYARLAERTHADLYCIGTELVQMTTGHPDEWRNLISGIRKVYHGPITYDAHWGQELDRVSFWDTLDFIGVSAYFPLDAPERATVDDIVSAWRPYRKKLALLSERFHRPVLFLEIGYRPVTGTYRTPWSYIGGQPDPGAQARAYEALFLALSDAAWWKGAYIWKTFTDPKFVDEDDGEGFSFRGRPAEAVVRKWYGGNSTARLLP